MQSPVKATLPLSIIDKRPFFLKALHRGIECGLIDKDKLTSIHNDAPKCMVQIARYFGSEHLRPDLERARERLVNMVSIYLESSSNSDLDAAARTLSVNSLMFCSKSGSNILKKLISVELELYSDIRKPDLDKWTLASSDEVKSESLKRNLEQNKISFAKWICNEFNVKIEEIFNEGFSSESIIRTYFILSASDAKSFTSWNGFRENIKNLRAINKSLASNKIKAESIYPIEYELVAKNIIDQVVNDLKSILDKRLNMHNLFRCNDSFFGRYYWIES